MLYIEILIFKNKNKLVPFFLVKNFTCIKNTKIFPKDICVVCCFSILLSCKIYLQVRKIESNIEENQDDVPPFVQKSSLLMVP